MSCRRRFLRAALVVARVVFVYGGTLLVVIVETLAEAERNMRA